MDVEDIAHHSYDGTNIYKALYSSPTEDSKGAASPTPFENDSHVAAITRGSFS